MYIPMVVALMLVFPLPAAVPGQRRAWHFDRRHDHTHHCKWVCILGGR
jgi:hypothetical protein